MGRIASRHFRALIRSPSGVMLSCTVSSQSGADIWTSAVHPCTIDYSTYIHVCPTSSPLLSIFDRPALMVDFILISRSLRLQVSKGDTDCEIEFLNLRILSGPDSTLFLISPSLSPLNVLYLDSLACNSLVLPSCR